MKKSILLSLSALALLTGAAFAEPTVGIERQTRVVVGDLNLSSEAGIAVLFERLRVATNTVCGPAPVGTGAQADFDAAAYKTCKSAAFSRAIAKLGDKLPANVRTAAK